MKKIIIFIILGLTGCGNLSPRVDPELRQQIQNQQGLIEQIENNQNAIKNELFNIQNKTDIQGSYLDRIQQGLINSQSNNSGIQIFSGSGGLFLGLVGIISLLVIILHYRQKYVIAEMVSEILAQKIADHHDPDLEEDIFQAAMQNNVETQLYHLVTKYQKQNDADN